jgi:hypothetical protein
MAVIQRNTLSLSKTLSDCVHVPFRSFLPLVVAVTARWQECLIQCGRHYKLYTCRFVNGTRSACIVMSVIGQHESVFGQTCKIPDSRHCTITIAKYSFTFIILY